MIKKKGCYQRFDAVIYVIEFGLVNAKNILYSVDHIQKQRQKCFLRAYIKNKLV